MAEASTAELLQQNLSEYGLVRILAREDIAPELFRKLSVEEAAQAVQRSMRPPSSSAVFPKAKSKPRFHRVKRSKKKPKSAKKKTASKGGKNVRQPNYWRRVKNELRILICTNDKKYAGLRRQIHKHGSATQTTLVSYVASGIAVSLGYTVAAVVPFVAMALLALIQIGANAWCTGQS